ncbi:MAG TPA: fused MFS/spermidine synthase [Candidatus Limnocylindrales bacterium]
MRTAQIPRSSPRPLLPLAVLLAVFVLSGAAGLVYEVVWARQLVLVFGNTSQAVSTILTGFFGGLAVGGWLGGRLADRVARPLRLYGALELAIVVVVLVTPASFGLIGEAYRGVYEQVADVSGALALVRFGLAILALAPATILMGATLPTLTRFLTRRGSFVGAFTVLYAANTIGAIAGTALAGFVLIELLGLHGALLVGAACSTTAGLTALGLDALLGRREARAGASNGSARSVVRAGRDVEAESRPMAATGSGVGPGVGPRVDRAAGRGWTLALVLAFTSGLTSLGYQVVWNRLIGAGTGSSTYVFTIILTLFLVGIALGAVLFGLLHRLTGAVRGLIAAAQIAAAALVLLGTATVLASPQSPFLGIDPRFLRALRLFAQNTAIIVLPTTVALGVTFPATSALLREELGHEGAASGALLAVNTVGAIVATFVLPFVVIPLVGSPATLAGLAVTNALIGAALALGGRSVPRPVRFAGGLAGAVVAGAVVVSVVAGTAFRDPTVAWVRAHGGTVYQATEDEIASVVAGDLGAPQLWVAGTSMTLITVDTKLMPLLPLMLRPRAEHGLVIAFGMGTAFRSSLVAGVTTDAVELVPSVPRMFHWFYPDAAQVLADPRGRVIVADGRNHVELTSRTYDFVVVDPPPPIESSGVSVISTQGFYEAAKGRLNPDGVMMQWVPYGQTLDEFLAHVRTFASVFPQVRVIAGPGGAGFYMLGSDGPVELDPAAMRSVLERPGVVADLDSAPDGRGRDVDQWVATIQGLVWAHGDALRQAVGPGALVTDDRPLPEYFLLRRLEQPHAAALSLPALRALLPPGATP